MVTPCLQQDTHSKTGAGAVNARVSIYVALTGQSGQGTRRGDMGARLVGQSLWALGWMERKAVIQRGKVGWQRNLKAGNIAALLTCWPCRLRRRDILTYHLVQLGGGQVAEDNAGL